MEREEIIDIMIDETKNWSGHKVTDRQVFSAIIDRLDKVNILRISTPVLAAEEALTYMRLTGMIEKEGK